MDKRIHTAGLAAVGAILSGTAFAQADVCGNIRLSVGEQTECRSRITNNALGDAEAARIQKEFEDRIRNANDRLITPPVVGGTASRAPAKTQKLPDGDEAPEPPPTKTP